MLALLALAQGCSTPGASKHVISKMQKEVDQAATSDSRPDAVPEGVSKNLIPTINLGAADVPKINDEKRFDISVNNVPADQFFLSLVDGTDYNMVIHPEVKGNITLNLKKLKVILKKKLLRLKRLKKKR